MTRPSEPWGHAMYADYGYNWAATITLPLLEWPPVVLFVGGLPPLHFYFGHGSQFAEPLKENQQHAIHQEPVAQENASSHCHTGPGLAKLDVHLVGTNAAGCAVLHRHLPKLALLRLTANLAVCTISMEACCGSHYLGRPLLALGHEPRLMPPQVRDALCQEGEKRFM